MSDTKLAEALAGILRDFESLNNTDHADWGPQVELSREQVRALPPYSIYLTFVTFSKYRFFGRSEKIAWSVPLRFKTAPYLISHRKFGLRIHMGSDSEPNTQRDNELIDRLLHAVKITDGLIEPFARGQIQAGNVTIGNQCLIFRSKYEFFRDKAEECYQTPNRNPNETSLAAINRKLKIEREAFFYASAALDAYFSYLEHFLVLMLAFCDFNPEKDNLAEFITSLWKPKFKRIFDLGADDEAERIYHSLVRIKEKFRNPLSHGGFDQEAATLHFHVPGLGAVPMSLSRYAESIHYGLNPIDAVSFSEVCDVLDKAEAFFATGPKRLEVRCLMSGVDVAFNDQSLREYKKAVKSEDAADAFIEWQLNEMDNAANMDW